MKTKLLFLISLAISLSTIAQDNKQPQTAEPEIIAFFVHGIADSGKRQVQSMLKTSDETPYLLSMPCEHFNFACSTEGWWRINFWLCDLGQHDELKQMHEALEKLRDKNPNAKFILVGISRGASAIINYCANYKNDDISACILESPYDHIENLIDHHHTLKPLGDYARMFFKLLFPKCDLDHGIFPSNQINKIETDIPMLFVSVENDASIPLKCVLNLIEQRKDAKHQHVHHIHLQNGKHGNLMSGEDAEKYQNAGHAFFARYGLPHNAEFAKSGTAFL